MGERQREGGTEDTKWLRTDSGEPDVGLELTNLEIMTSAEVSRSTDCTTQVPQMYFFYRLALVPLFEIHKV